MNTVMMGKMIELLKNHKSYVGEYEQYKDLSVFINTLEKFNKYRP